MTTNLELYPNDCKDEEKVIDLIKYPIIVCKETKKDANLLEASAEKMKSLAAGKGKNLKSRIFK